MNNRWFIILIIFMIALIIGAIFLVSTVTENRDSEFSKEVNVIVEEYELTDYQIEKINYYKAEYIKTIGALSIDSFERFIKAEDYDFWYEIKLIFEGLE